MERNWRDQAQAEHEIDVRMRADKGRVTCNCEIDEAFGRDSLFDLSLEEQEGLRQQQRPALPFVEECLGVSEFTKRNGASASTGRSARQFNSPSR